MIKEHSYYDEYIQVDVEEGQQPPSLERISFKALFLKQNQKDMLHLFKKFT